jgi:hypothetical protein
MIAVSSLAGGIFLREHRKASTSKNPLLTWPKGAPSYKGFVWQVKTWTSKRSSSHRVLERLHYPLQKPTTNLAHNGQLGSNQTWN